MTNTDLAMLRHLAKEVKGAEFARTRSGLEYFWFPATDGRVVRRVFSLVGWNGHPNMPCVWNPLLDANDCRDLVVTINRPMAVNRDPQSRHGLWYVAFLEYSPRSGGHGRDWSAFGDTQERATCEAAVTLTHAAK